MSTAPSLDVDIPMRNPTTLFSKGEYQYCEDLGVGVDNEKVLLTQPATSSIQGPAVLWLVAAHYRSLQGVVLV